MRQAAQLKMQVDQSPRIAVQRKRLNRLFGTGRPYNVQFKKPIKPMQRLEDEDLISKTEKKRKSTLQKKYYNSLGVMTPLYTYAEEDFDHYFENATSLDNLEALIDKAIKKAEKKKEAAESKEATDKKEIPIESLSSTSTISAVSIPKKTAPKKKKRNKKKKWKDITAKVLTSGPSMVQEAVYFPQTVTNTLLQNWIGGKPGGAICTFGGIHVSDDTVYIYATVDIRDTSMTDFPQWNRYEIEAHYHPVPESDNYLHVKGRAGGSTQNVLGAGNWLIPGGRATLREAVQQWNSANPMNKSPHSW